MSKKYSQVFIVLGFILVFFCVSKSSILAFEVEDEAGAVGQFLYDIGLIKGDGKDLQLKQLTTRAQAAVMVVRLLGAEEETMNMKYTHPFLDVPKWADPYVGYLYQRGIVNGVSADHFGSDVSISASQYMTFMLRLIGYNDSEGDFVWNQSIKKAFELGIINENDYQWYPGINNFLREHMFRFTYDILGAQYQQSGESLLKNLIDLGVVPRDSMMRYKVAPYSAPSTSYKVYNSDQFMKRIINGILNFEEDIAFEIPLSWNIDYNAEIRKAYNEASLIPGCYTLIHSSSYDITTTNTNRLMTLHMKYRVSGEDLFMAKELLRANAEGLLEDAYVDGVVSDYELLLLIHDKIIKLNVYPRNIAVDDLPSDVFTFVGMILNLRGVCSGYADAISYFSALMGLEARTVTGKIIDTGVLHAWNVIRLDGVPYQTDATWDDMEYGMGISYTSRAYLNITDEEMKIDHDYQVFPGWEANSSQQNYFVKENLLYTNRDEIFARMEEGFKQKVPAMEFKLVGAEITDEEFREFLETNPYAGRGYYQVYKNGVVGIYKYEY